MTHQQGYAVKKNFKRNAIPQQDYYLSVVLNIYEPPPPFVLSLSKHLKRYSVAFETAFLEGLISREKDAFQVRV